MNAMHLFRAMVLAVMLAAPQAVWSQETATLRFRAELKAEQFTDAQTLVTIEKDGRVEVLRRQGGWVRVKAGAREGWLRAEALVLAAPPPPPVPVSGAGGLLGLASGRAGRGDLIATTGIRGFAKPPSSQIHALIMTIGAYQGGIPPLRGVQYDIETARAIARRMGVPEGNILALKDGELTLAGMRKAFDEFESRVLDNDQVFIYYSGHGGRQMVNEPETGERCAESLVTVDGYGFIDSELEARLKRLSSRAQKVVVFLDACHSGGVTTRAAPSGADAPYSAKYWQPRGGGSEACSRPVNVVKRGISTATRSPGSGGANFAYIAAARDDEVSLDQPGRGGVASQAWLACMAGAARDIDGSGGLSAEEIRICAQERIEQELRNVKGFLPHHVAITGNSNMVLSYAAREVPETGLPVPPGPPPAGAVPAKPAPPPAAQAGTSAQPGAGVSPPAKTSPLAALNDIFNSRDDRRLVSLLANKPVVRIGKDSIEFSLSSRETGYVYLLMVGSDGETFDLLFPNQLDRDNQVRAGETLFLPRANWRLSAEGPPGKNTLLAIVADSPKDFSRAGLRPAGPFSTVEAAAAKDIQLVTASSQAAGDECDVERQKRTFAVQRRCSAAYGAALLTIEEAN